MHNRIDAEFEFRDGPIIRHRDRFALWHWSTPALGPTGRLLGWTRLVKDRVRAQDAQRLDAFIEHTHSRQER